MASLNMNGPYLLNDAEIDKHIPSGSIGNYAYGYTKDGTFYIKYVGRSDSDLNERIRHGIGQYPEFKFSLASSKKAAYEKECQNYHDFGGLEGKLDNEIHPDKPDGTNYSCPVCPKWMLDI